MADVEKAVYAILSANAGVTALISTRIYPTVIPQDVALPAVAYQRISTRPLHTQGNPATIARIRVQTTALATTYAQAKSVAAAVKAALNGYRGTSGNITVRAATLADEADGYASENNIYEARQDWFIWIKE